MIGSVRLSPFDFLILILIFTNVYVLQCWLCWVCETLDKEKLEAVGGGADPSPLARSLV